MAGAMVATASGTIFTTATSAFAGAAVVTATAAGAATWLSAASIITITTSVSTLMSMGAFWSASADFHNIEAMEGVVDSYRQISDHLKGYTRVNVGGSYREDSLTLSLARHCVVVRNEVTDGRLSSEDRTAWSGSTGGSIREYFVKEHFRRSDEDGQDERQDERIPWLTSNDDLETHIVSYLIGQVGVADWHWEAESCDNHAICDTCVLCLEPHFNSVECETCGDYHCEDELPCHLASETCEHLDVDLPRTAMCLEACNESLVSEQCFECETTLRSMAVCLSHDGFARMYLAPLDRNK